MVAQNEFVISLRGFMDQQTANLEKSPQSQERQEPKSGFFRKTWPFIAAMIMVVILLLSIKAAWSSGRSAAQSKLILANVKGLQEALGFFYDDQNRFPTALEFDDRNIMMQYSNFYPPTKFVSKVCSQSFVYKRVSKNSYNLSFCLPKKEGGFKQGWNQVTINK